ncbi:beta-1,4-galactosyltransferase 4-like [Ylistrum balloti]|uniref:beta-1,4-galactosyltransferase 4-like n=1 Tax=Ylistrum balloti TaxID=509963 RepID=UPI0029058263|nr:beta-1,4-galactosyltransferase 4-like [Ylistrum balloti]
MVIGLLLLTLIIHQMAVTLIVTHKINSERRTIGDDLLSRYTTDKGHEERNKTEENITTSDGQVPRESTQHQPTSFMGNLPDCVHNQSTFHGREPITMKYHQWNHLEKMFADTVAGRWRPMQCQAKFRVAIIIPYKDRDPHLKLFIANVLPKLQRQQLDYTIYVVEQTPENHFNRGMMRNIGFVEASKHAKYDCYVFNDVDTLIEDDRNLFMCDNLFQQKIHHIGAFVDMFDYKLLYEKLIGGILSVTYKQFVKANGYSNCFFVWGGEDDNLCHRFHSLGYQVIRPSEKVGHITTLFHERDPEVNERNVVLKKVRNHTYTDGLNTLQDKYTLVVREERKLFTWLYVRVNEELIKHYIASIPTPKPPPPKLRKKQVNGRRNAHAVNGRRS